jgi:hypothetical protein
MARLLQELIMTIESRGAKEGEIPSSLLFEIYSMSRNNMSKVISDSATWVDPQLIDTMLDQGIIQRIISENTEKYALTFKGIAQAVQIKYGNTLDEQFLTFLEQSDHKFATTEQTPLSWKEKLAGLSLILVASTSISSAIRLNNDANKAVLGDVFEKTLDCLKKFGLVEKSEALKIPSRGEHPASALMARVNQLARKTNLYYKNDRDVSGYYFDIEKDGDIDSKRLFLLLRKVFGYYNPNCNYGEMYKGLEQISQLYSPKFLARSINPMISLSILKRLKEFMNHEIWHLPQQSQLHLAVETTSKESTRDHISNSIKKQAITKVPRSGSKSNSTADHKVVSH